MVTLLVLEQPRQHAVDDSRADLALDVVADDRQAVLLEASPPGGFAGDEDRNAIDHAAARRERLLHVEARSLLAAHGQVVHQHLGAAVAQGRRDVDRGLGCLIDDLAQVGAQTVERRSALHRDTEVRDLGEAYGVVRFDEQRFGDVATDFAAIDVEGGDDLDVADVVAAEVHVHEARYEGVGGGVAILVDALDEGRGAVAEADHGHANRPSSGGSDRGHAASVTQESAFRKSLSGYRFPANVFRRRFSG